MAFILRGIVALLHAEYRVCPSMRSTGRVMPRVAAAAARISAPPATKKGGSSSSSRAAQAAAISHAISRGLTQADPENRKLVKPLGYLTRDPRMKERKKYGQKGARKRFQYSKR